MKRQQRNLLILAVLPAAVAYATFLVVSSTAVPVRQHDAEANSGAYRQSLKTRLIQLVQQNSFEEAEIVFRRVQKLGNPSRGMLRLGSVVYFRNGKLNEAENLLRNMLLRDPGDHICRNNYGMVLMARKRHEALGELRKAWMDSGKSAFIGKNFRHCAKLFNVTLPDTLFAHEKAGESAPLDAVTLEEEKK